jgi:hypothetical protein
VFQQPVSLSRVYTRTVAAGRPLSHDDSWHHFVEAGAPAGATLRQRGRKGSPACVTLEQARSRPLLRMTPRGVQGAQQQVTGKAHCAGGA